MLRLIPHLQHPDASVIVVTKSEEYAKSLLDNLRVRAAEGVEPWAKANFKPSRITVEMENGAWLRIFGVPDDDPAEWGLCGLQFTYAFISRSCDEPLATFLKTRARSATYPGPIGWEVLEEWRDNPLVQPKEKDDKAVL